MFDPSLLTWLGYVVLFLLVAPLFPFLYVVLRWRTDGRAEPGGGTYGALLYFCVASILLAIAGAANLSYGWISTAPPTDRFEELRRLSWGMFVGSGLFFAINLLLLFLGGARPEWRDARRVFVGFLMVMAGLVTMTVLVLFFITLFERVDLDDSNAVIQHGDDLKLYGSWTVYYLSVFLAARIALVRGARREI